MTTLYNSKHNNNKNCSWFNVDSVYNEDILYTLINTLGRILSNKSFKGIFSFLYSTDAYILYCLLTSLKR